MASKLTIQAVFISGKQESRRPAELVGERQARNCPYKVTREAALGKGTPV